MATEFANQLDFEILIKQDAKAQRIASRARLPDRIVIEEADPRRHEATKWAADYDWHMAVHECRGLLEMRKDLRVKRPDAFVHPVIYCNAWPIDKDRESWIQKGHYGHVGLTGCPYCDADLPGGKGQIILERRTADKPYEAVFERDWPTEQEGPI